MLRKSSSKFLFTFVVTIALLYAANSDTFAQGDNTETKRQSSESASQAEALFQNALLLFDKQESGSVRRQLQEAMHLWVQMRQPAKAGKAALQMGDRYKQIRKYQEALEYYQQALQVKLLPGVVRANALNAIALIYADLYLHDLAVSYFKRALELSRSLHDLPMQTSALMGLADISLQRGALENALELVTLALRLNKQGSADADPALLHLKGLVNQKQGHIENAKEAFEDALVIYKKNANVGGQVKILCAMSTLYLLASQKQTAREYAEQAVALAEKQEDRTVSYADDVNTRELRWRAWLSRARAERALGQKERALDSYSWAKHHMAGMWWAVYMATEASAVSFREEAQAAYREYTALLIELGRIQEAYELSDEAKARTVLNFTGARRMRPSSVMESQTATENELSQTILRLRLRLLEASLNREQQAKLQKELEEAEYRKQEAQAQAEMAHSVERLVWTNLITAEQLQKKMAQEQMALAEFTLGESHSFVWLFTRGEIFSAILPPRREIEKAVKAYLDALATPPNHLQLEKSVATLKPQAAALFAMLFGDLSLQLETGKPLLIVPDGLLHYLPFEALMQNGHYLIEDHEISYAPSASMLVLLQESTSRIASRDRLELLAVGDVVFEANATTSDGKEAPHGLSKRARQMLAARDFHLTQLPRTRDEILAIANLFAADQRKVLMGSASTEEAIKREPLRRYRRLHFATHSLIDEHSPFRSAVILTPGEQGEEDGLLEVNEIARLDLDCDLVVVSACQTGRGQLLSGEGIVGLSRAFFYAGARSVVVSLWNVSDISTGQLMKDFYQNLTAGQCHAAALQKAKLEMLGSGKSTRHPYYWASFVLVGKP
ncbi:MAG: CHAT domain-containing protein [Acidobacteria bacterium]|nr:CHAT domain-containing protein [Acidobacteriota bacterium]